MNNLLTGLQELDKLNALNVVDWPRLTLKQGWPQLYMSFNPLDKSDLRPASSSFNYYRLSQMFFLTRYFGRVKPLYPCPQDTPKTVCRQGSRLREVIVKATGPPGSSP